MNSVAQIAAADMKSPPLLDIARRTQLGKTVFVGSVVDHATMGRCCSYQCMSEEQAGYQLTNKALAFITGDPDS